MNTYNRRSRPNARHRVKFYVPTNTTTSTGELAHTFTFHGSGYFAMEKPMKPREVIEGGRNVNEQEFLLIGQWTRLLADVTHGMICLIPAKQLVCAVNGHATDPWGDRKKIHIYVVDNVTKEFTRGLLPGA